MLKAVIIDDESKAIESLSWEISNFKNEIEIIKTFTNPEEGIKFINSNKIDCLFLDIEMPKMDGFKVLEKLDKKDFSIIITTAYDEYGIKALKNNATDYLLKPVDSDDLEESIQKIKIDNEKRHQINEKFEDIFTKFNEKLNEKKITISTDGKLVFLEKDEIIYIESDGNYSSLHLINGKKIVLTKKLKEVNTLLPEDYFFRIHNSYIVNLNKVKEFYKADGYVVLQDNHKIPVSRQKKSEFLNKL